MSDSAAGFYFNRHHGRMRGTEKVVTLPSGERVRKWRDDSRTVIQIEHDESLDAIVRPKAVSMPLVIPRLKAIANGTGRPLPVTISLYTPSPGGK